jgi:NADPH-dependent ferric siderophore reductase
VVPENMRVFFHEIDAGVTSRWARHARPGRYDQLRATQIWVRNITVH